MVKKLVQNWLGFIGLMVPDARDALVIGFDAELNQAKVIGRWPDQARPWPDFEKILRYTLKKNDKVYFSNVSNNGGEATDLFAVPLNLHTDFSGIVAIRTVAVAPQRQQQIFALIENSLRWLKLYIKRQYKSDLFYGTAMGVMAACVEQHSYKDALLCLATELKEKLACDHVAIGEFGQYHTSVSALSSNADFDKKSTMMQRIAAAMDEAIEQDCAISFPAVPATVGDPGRAENNRHRHISLEHARLAGHYGAGSVYTRPLAQATEVFGAVTLLRGEEKPFSSNSRQICDHILALITPYLILKKNEERSLLSKTTAALTRKTQMLFGFRYLKTKLCALSLLAVIIAGSLLEGDFRVTADSVLEGKIQRVIASPISGYLISASARAGDIVQQGEVMAKLDTSDLELEMSRRQGELQKLHGEYREALAKLDQVTTQVVKARIRQTDAELELLQRQFQKTDLTAPFDGVVIQGDLSQMLGSPVERGDGLLTIAPLQGYRIILKVDERAIAHVKPGQRGMLSLTSLPEREFKLSVDSITEAAQPGDGISIFRVEASLDSAEHEDPSVSLLRPGMEGVGKIYVDRAKLIWIWTHELVEWLRLWLWRWLP